MHAGTGIYARYSCEVFKSRMARIVNRVGLTKEVLTWVVPAVGIPALRYFQDNHTQRNELFIRDASTYAMGALLFLSLYNGGKSVLKRLPRAKSMSESARDLTAFLTALSANILYAGVGAVKFSQRYQDSRTRDQPGSINASDRNPVYNGPNTFNYWA